MTAEQISIPAAKPLSMAVTVHDGQTVLHLSEPREYVALTGPEPLMIGQRMILAAVEARPDVGEAAIATALALVDGVYEIRGDLKPAGGPVKYEMMERHRRTLTRRLEVVLNSTREKKRVNNAALAKDLVEICIKEILA